MTKVDMTFYWFCKARKLGKLNGDLYQASLLAWYEAASLMRLCWLERLKRFY